MINIVFDVFFDSSAVEQVYYKISIAGSVLVGGFLTLWTLGLGWLSITLFKELQIQAGLISGILCIATIAPGPVNLFKGLRELCARIRRLAQKTKEEKKDETEATEIPSQSAKADEIATTTITYSDK